MTLPTSFFGQSDRISGKNTDNAPRFTPRTDLQWGRHLFQPPSLPTPAQRLEALSLAAGPRTRGLDRR